VRDRPAEDEERLFVANNLAVALNDNADCEVALGLLEEVLAVRKRTLGDDHPNTLDSMTNLALQYHEMGRFADALPLGVAAVATARRMFGGDDAEMREALATLGAIYASMGMYVEGQPLLQEALNARRRTLGDDHHDTMNSTMLLGRCHVGMGECEVGLALLRETVARAERVLGSDHPSTRHFAEALRLGDSEFLPQKHARWPGEQTDEICRRRQGESKPTNSAGEEDVKQRFWQPVQADGWYVAIAFLLGGGILFTAGVIPF